MSDTTRDKLYRLAESQGGYFTTGQAVEVGVDRSALRHHARPNGRYIPIRRGLYRLRHFPSHEFEHVVSAWLPLRAAGAVVSHSSALELHDLADVIPDAVHISVPRAKRGQRPRPGVRLHYLNAPLSTTEQRMVHGVPVTSLERAIVDSLEYGEQPEQVELAVHQALERGLTTPRRLRAVAQHRSARVRGFIDGTLREGQL